MKEEQTKEIAPHPEYQVNNLYYERMNRKVRFGPEVRIKESRWDGNITNIQYSYGEFGPCAKVFVLNFHQENKTFRIEVCGIFNHLGYKGLLERIDNPKPPGPTDWEIMFGK